MQRLTGIGVSPGVVAGRAVILIAIGTVVVGQTRMQQLDGDSPAKRDVLGYVHVGGRAGPPYTSAGGRAGPQTRPVTDAPGPYFRAARSSRQACSQRRQASAQTRQCACMGACRSHSSPQLLQLAAQASSSGLVTSAS